jgi:hypothetical protein
MGGRDGGRKEGMGGGRKILEDEVGRWCGRYRARRGLQKIHRALVLTGHSRRLACPDVTLRPLPPIIPARFRLCSARPGPQACHRSPAAPPVARLVCLWEGPFSIFRSMSWECDWIQVC